jgi:hypothetical protein
MNILFLFMAVLGFCNLAHAEDRYLVVGNAVVRDHAAENTLDCDGDENDTVKQTLTKEAESQADQNAKGNCQQIGFSSADKVKDYTVSSSCIFSSQIRVSVSDTYECH